MDFDLRQVITKRRPKTSPEPGDKRFSVYITMGGLMEDPGFHDEYHATIYSSDKDSAIEEWLRINPKFDDPQYLRKGQNGEGWSYWGWVISCHQISN
ncbi:hypothetical protein SP15_201 [Bacillus phage SP-15]|uniref:Uncharacterized protein n=1 Tax=Bacillus phage SP-15 TaxID=1792032 RepID=A0A127AYZ4_9CAUD|nr:hypothetical protein SP15_201 [Bacillus phage SP-15]AMM45001.1 hypothetical protein SP15_201 [Bacillus phage SP-15]